MTKPVSSVECKCHECGVEFYIWRTNPTGPEQYLYPNFCPGCGASKSLQMITTSFTIGKRPDAKRGDHWLLVTE